MNNFDRQISQTDSERLAALQAAYPDKFLSQDQIFSQIHRGDRLFISTACGEPQYLVQALVDYVQDHPKALFDA